MVDLNCIFLKYFIICKIMGDWEVVICIRLDEILVYVGLFDNKKKWLGKVWKRVKIEYLVYEKKMKIFKSLWFLYKKLSRK